MENTPEEKIRRGKRAEQLQADPVLVEALNAVRQKQIDSWAGSSPEKPEQRERAYFMLRAVDELTMQLNAFAGDGKFEERRIQKRG